jgi:hypothetical protein
VSTTIEAYRPTGVRLSLEDQTVSGGGKPRRQLKMGQRRTMGHASITTPRLYDKRVVRVENSPTFKVSS